MSGSASSNDKPINLLVATSTYPRRANDPDPGFVHELCRRLANNHIQVTVLAPRAPGLAELEVMDGVNVRRFGYFVRSAERLAYDGGILSKLRQQPWLYLLVPFFVAGLWWALRRELRRDYDLVHAHWVVPQGLAAAWARKSRLPPLLVTLHGGDLFGLRQWPMPSLKGRALRASQRIAVVSQHMRDVLMRDFAAPGERIAVLPMGVDLQQRYTIDPTEERVPGSILFVGRLVEKKGVRYLLEAFALARSSLPELTLDIAGDGPLRDELQRRASELRVNDRVRFLGPKAQAQIPTLFRRASLAVVPSIVADSGDQEGLGLVTIEAMGCGCPVVASDLPAIRDVVCHNETGRMAAPADASALADAIETAFRLPDETARLAENARRYVEQHFDWQQVADRYTEEIRRLAR